MPPATIVPTVESPPAIPFTLHVTPVPEAPEPPIVAVKSCAPSVATLALAGETAIVMLVPLVTVTLAEPLADVSAWLTAVTVTVGGDGSAPGAAYAAVSPPLDVIVPTAELPPATPFTSQVTPVFELPVTVASNCCVPPSAMVALAGSTVTVTVVEPDGGDGVEYPGGVPAFPQFVSANIARHTSTSGIARRTFHQQEIALGGNAGRVRLPLCSQGVRMSASRKARHVPHRSSDQRHRVKQGFRSERAGNCAVTI